MSKPTLHLAANTDDARNLAKLYERLTGKRVSKAEIDAAQKKLDAANKALTVNGARRS